MNPHLRFVAATMLAAVTLAAMFAAACGDDAGGSSSTSTPGAANMPAMTMTPGGMAGMDHSTMPMGSMTPGAGGGMGNMAGMMMDGNVPAGTVVVHLSNWIVSASQSVVKAGDVHFRVMHMPVDMHSPDGAGKYHQLDVVRKNADGTYEVVGRTNQLGYGEQQDLTLTLAPGEYVLQCSMVEVIDGKAVSHYVMGMHTPFTVE